MPKRTKTIRVVRTTYTLRAQPKSDSEWSQPYSTKKLALHAYFKLVRQWIREQWEKRTKTAEQQSLMHATLSASFERDYDRTWAAWEKLSMSSNLQDFASLSIDKTKIVVGRIPAHGIDVRRKRGKRMILVGSFKHMNDAIAFVRGCRNKDAAQYYIEG